MEDSMNRNQEKKFKIFKKKVPSNSKNDIKKIIIRDKNYSFQAISKGRNPKSKALYEKLVDIHGKTIRYTKTTFIEYNRILHVKDKIIDTYIPVKEAI